MPCLSLGANAVACMRGQLLWRKPTQAALAELLHNPAYTGAFVYGRSGPAPDGRPGQHAAR